MDVLLFAEHILPRIETTISRPQVDFTTSLLEEWMKKERTVTKARAGEINMFSDTNIVKWIRCCSFLSKVPLTTASDVLLFIYTKSKETIHST